MKLTSITRSILKCRRERRRLLAAGYEEVSEGGGKLWELHRGWRIGHLITDVKVAPEGRSIFIKVEDSSRKHFEKASFHS